MRRLCLRTGGWMLAVLLTGMAGTASARDTSREFGYQGWGPRVGLSFSPDQFFAGAHVDLGDIFPYRLRFQPSAEIGFGDHFTTIQIDANLQYHFNRDWEAWRPYVGGSLGLVSMSSDTFDDQSNFGLAASAGIEKNIGRDAFFIESKVNIEDTPDFKVFVGWIF